MEKREKDLISLEYGLREIMGRNFFGIEEAIQYFGINPSHEQLITLSKIPFPFSKATLQNLKDTHILVAVFPLSILELRAKIDSKFFYDESWYGKGFVFATECDEVSWKLVRKSPVDNSTSKSWRKQLVLLGEDEEVPRARVMIYTIIGHFLATGERLFEHIYVRTLDRPRDYTMSELREYIYVGFFDSFCYFWDENPVAYIGIASVRKEDL